MLLVQMRLALSNNSAACLCRAPGVGSLNVRLRAFSAIIVCPLFNCVHFTRVPQCAIG